MDLGTKLLARCCSVLVWVWVGGGPIREWRGLELGLSRQFRFWVRVQRLKIVSQFRPGFSRGVRTVFLALWVNDAGVR